MASGNQGRPGRKPAKSTKSSKSTGSAKPAASKPGAGKPPAAKATPAKPTKPPAKATAAGKGGAAGPAKAAKAAGSGKAAAAGGGAARARRSSGGGPSRVERLEAARRQRQRRSLWLRLGVAGAALVVVGVFFVASRGSDTTVTTLEAGAGGCAYDTDFDGTARTQGEHIPSPGYTVDPPAGGAHEPTAAPAGFYTTQDVPSDGKLVHAMEHGFIVLWHRPDVSEETRQEIEDLSDRFGRELIVVPRSSLEGEVAVTAWHRRLLCDELVPDKVARFTDEYKDKGPEKGFL